MKGNLLMMQKIQKFGGAMFTPVLLFSFAGVVVGITTLFTTQVIFGDLAAPTSIWYKFWWVLNRGGYTVFNQMPLLFAVALPIGLAKKQNARCCMEALVTYLTFHYFVSTILTLWGPELGFADFANMSTGASTGLALVASIKTLDMGMIGALCISGITVWAHNKYFDTELPDWLGIFSGSVFVYMISFFLMIPVAAAACLIWPHIQDGIRAFQGFIATTGTLGVWVFTFMERILIPTGLHHLIYTPFFYDNVVVQGGSTATWAAQLSALAADPTPLKEAAPYIAFNCTGWSKMFGCLGIALAFYKTAKPNKKVETAALLIPVTLTAFLCGITEPIEYTFLFIAPQLFVVHAFLAACLSATMNFFGVVGEFSGGLIKALSLNILPLGASHGMTYVIGAIIGFIYTGIYFVVFSFLITKFDFKTPGREDDDEAVKLRSKAEYLESKGGKTASVAAAKEEGKSKRLILAENVLDLLGGKDNIEDVTNCATRLRVNVKDESIVAPEADFKAIGTHGLSQKGKAVQVIIGLSVPQLREVFEGLLD